ncbi:MAG: hypothetical protein JW764_02455 [Chlorobiaceae bacterium]|nr:hypothetical protein [Chlorobiaceae bacterium]
MNNKGVFSADELWIVSLQLILLLLALLLAGDADKANQFDVLCFVGIMMSLFSLNGRDANTVGKLLFGVEYGRYIAPYAFSLVFVLMIYFNAKYVDSVVKNARDVDMILISALSAFAALISAGSAYRTFMDARFDQLLSRLNGIADIISELQNKCYLLTNKIFFEYKNASESRCDSTPDILKNTKIQEAKYGEYEKSWEKINEYRRELDSLSKSLFSDICFDELGEMLLKVKKIKSDVDQIYNHYLNELLQKKGDS